MDESTENNQNIYCPICNEQLEETGKPGWAFCTVHGWIKYKTHDEQKTAGLLSKINLKAASLAQQAKKKIGFIRNTSTIIIFIISAIFITGFLGFILGYFDWKSPSHKSLEIKHLKVPVQKDETTKEAQSQVSLPTGEAQSQVSVLPKEAVPLREDKDEKKETKEKSIQPQKPSKPIFTVQAGAFRNAFHAKSLKTMLTKKGYDAYINISRSKKGEVLYKVWIGEFSDREKAETLAAKIKTAESIQTFVALR
jgi:cell division septation protein DedD